MRFVKIFLVIIGALFLSVVAGILFDVMVSMLGLPSIPTIELLIGLIVFWLPLGYLYQKGFFKKEVRNEKQT